MSETAAPTDVPTEDVSEPQRPVRMCDSCGGVDDHPRHVVATPIGDSQTAAQVGAIAIGNASEADKATILAQVMDTSTTVKHMDCCRTDGCPDGTCNSVTAGVENLRGLDLLDHLVSLPTPNQTPEG